MKLQQQHIYKGIRVQQLDHRPKLKNLNKVQGDNLKKRKVEVALGNQKNKEIEVRANDEAHKMEFNEVECNPTIALT